MSNDGPLDLKGVAQAAFDNHPGISSRDLEMLAKQRGHKIVHSTLTKMQRGAYFSRPSKETLEALAFLADLPLDDVYEAAGRPMPERSLAEDLPPEADLLDGAQRRAVIEIVRQLALQNRRLADLQLKSTKAGEERDHSSASTNEADQPDADVLPFRGRSAEADTPEPPAKETPKASRKSPSKGRERKRRDDQETD